MLRRLYKVAEMVSVGSAAPDFAYAASGGTRERLSQFWQGQPALVLWLRHFG